MSSLPKISQADLEKLNCYLDGTLSHKEKVEFEVKLARSLPLQSTLREYTILRNILRSVPQKRAPRHFTLTTLEAQQIKRPVLLAPIFSFASLVTVMLLAIVFAGDWIFKNMSAPVVITSTEAPMVAAVPKPSVEIAKSQAKTEAPLIFNWGNGAMGAYGMGGGGGGKMIGGGDGMTNPYPSYSFDTRVINPSISTGPAEGLTMSAQPTSQPETLQAVPSTEPTQAQPLAKIPADYAGAIIWGLLPADEGKVIDVYPTATPAGQPETDAARAQVEATSPAKVQTAKAPYQTAPWIKYALAGLTVLFGLLAYFFSRRMS